MSCRRSERNTLKNTVKSVKKWITDFETISRENVSVHSHESTKVSEVMEETGSVEDQKRLADQETIVAPRIFTKLNEHNNFRLLFVGGFSSLVIKLISKRIDS